MEPTTQNQTTVANSTPATKSFDKKQLITPVAIIIAGIIIAFSLNTSKLSTSKGSGSDLISGALAKPEPEVAKVTSSDHIRGNKNAEIVIIEYSDIECPFCKVYHQTLKKIYDEYGKDNKVAWVYRHSPIPQLHPYAHVKAIATECVAQLAGKDAFWKNLDVLTTQ